MPYNSFPLKFQYTHGITAIDAGYIRPLCAAIHLIEEKGRVALVDTGINRSIPHVLSVLSDYGLTPDCVDYILLTHIHLDHAGGAGLMMQHFPQATLLVHARGIRHMIDPQKLIAGVTAVYGKAEAQKHYGEILPICAERIREAKHGDTITLAGRPLTIYDTPGHARHHVCYHDIKSNGIFTGDIFGISYPSMNIKNEAAEDHLAPPRQFIFPTTSPVQFSPNDMHHSIDLLLSLKPDKVYCTHFGELYQVAEHAEDLHRQVEAHATIGLRHQHVGAQRHEKIKEDLAQLLLNEARQFGTPLSSDALLTLWNADLELNTQGVEIWLDQPSKS